MLLLSKKKIGDNQTEIVDSFALAVLSEDPTPQEPKK